MQKQLQKSHNILFWKNFEIIFLDSYCILQMLFNDALVLTSCSMLFLKTSAPSRSNCLIKRVYGLCEIVTLNKNYTEKSREKI